MSVPQHQEGCRTRMFPTKCPDCGDPVYFFECSCGSRIFFDRAGSPWPRHADRCIEYMVRRYKEEENLSFHDLQERVRQWARERDVLINPEVMRRVAAMANRAMGSTTVLEIAPNPGEVALDGVITALDLQVNVLKRFNLTDGPFARALYAPLLKSPQAVISVRGARDDATGFANQFTFFYPLADARGQGIKLNMRVGCLIECLSLPGDKAVWVATDVRPL